jgi:hypothetical protein
MRRALCILIASSAGLWAQNNPAENHAGQKQPDQTQQRKAKKPKAKTGKTDNRDRVMDNPTNPQDLRNPDTMRPRDPEVVPPIQKTPPPQGRPADPTKPTVEKSPK